MADTTQAPVNGNYPAQHAYPADSYAAVNNTNNNYQPTQSSTPTNPPPANDSKHEIPKDEVGWYFVEQYYTTLSRSPEKLHLFYSRRSQFVFGNEAESVPVVVGQKAIQEKIRELDFHDCKVRVLNVDSQASFENILVSVIGEISNRSEPSRKFVQTFVLAEQPNGYYVLNDIFRYLADEDEEFVEQAPPAEAPAATQDAAVANAEPQPEKQAVEAQADTQAAAAKVDEKPEAAAAAANGEPEKAPEPAPQANGSAVQPEKPAVPVTPAVPVVPAEQEAVKPEVPKTQEPIPAANQAAPAPEKEAPPPAKAAPKTWASIASKNDAGAASVATPVVPVTQPKPAAAPAPATAQQQQQQQQQQQSQQPQQDQQPAAAATTATTENAPSQQSSNDGSGWQTAGHDNKRQSRAGDEQKFSAYIKNVNEKVDAALLKSTLAKFGKILYFDVNRQKNCAFVDFADQAGYNAAVAANPHQIGSEQIYVEERRIRPNNYGNGYGAGRGGAGRGRGDARAGSQGRGGFQRDSGRGGFAPRGRGGNVASKGRSQPQAA
ncbi:hypothetical protein VTN96DRAFT_9684 [Rasamsonia emersonii]|uniref:NTF2 and RRM domain protein n=1 Tax=Rasamsonia emersonii (strain ATCC 16479 / CBS 393.64 / IMI 116815) TaxID=1408163 RepID=A0A0F4YK94_RASE3|nr:NTF2 and RRM domain protein [Rasamsonia emersonii CBS 393.64]KKA18281.1 NTF2 and RRM domain protein [Rasamsonia emersonii CBS 393.64]